MAIKGKSRPKGGGKPVTRGPKPSYTPVRQPLLGRRSFWIGTAVVGGVLAVAGLWYGLARERTNAREQDLKDALRTAGSAYQSKVDPILAPVGQAQPPSGFLVFTAFSDAMGAFKNGKGDPGALSAAAADAAGRAKKAADALDKVDAVAIVRDKGLDKDFVLYVINSKARMVEGLRLYHLAASLAQDAMKASGAEQEELLARAQDALDLAGTVFGEGYDDYVQARLQAGVFQPTVPTGIGAGGLPGGIQPGGVTGASGG